MKKLFFILSALCSQILLQAQNTDSLFYIDQDTTGWAKEIADEETAWDWTDTLRDGDYYHIDSCVLAMAKKYRNIPDLAKDINLAFETDEEKIRAIFIWMTKTIVYDYIEYESKNKSMGNVSYSKGTPKIIIAEKWEKIYFNYATKVLRNKRGVCEGYATLFYELCRYTNINCQMVTGFAKNDADKINKYKKQKYVPTNHAWNKVLLNGQWLYIDVTWASTGEYHGKRTEPTSYSPFYYLVKKTIYILIILKIR